MGLLTYGEGSATIGTTEWSLPANAAAPSAVTDVGVYELRLNISALATGDEYLLQGYEKVRSSEGATRFLQVSFVGAQPDAQHVILLGALSHGWDATLKKISGTDRSISWSFRRAV